MSPTRSGWTVPAAAICVAMLTGGCGAGTLCSGHEVTSLRCYALCDPADDLIPYFQGVTTRTGAPFCFGSFFP